MSMAGGYPVVVEVDDHRYRHVVRIPKYAGRGKGAFCMPMPKTLAKVNRVVFNPVIRRVASRIPPMAILIHRGRNSGKYFRTPIFAFPTDDGFVIALVYGRNTDWERNVVTAGSCDLVYRNSCHALTDHRFIKKDEAETFIALPIRLALRLLRVDTFLRWRHVS